MVLEVISSLYHKTIKGKTYRHSVKDEIMVPLLVDDITVYGENSMESIEHS